MQIVIKPIMVEVNQNNVQAINLYKKIGFKQIDIRRKYYPNNEDALIMQ
jgi:ribosomal-protein-alanine N-acetyltransferase